MVYNVSFMCNGVGCANLVDADADIETAKEYFIQEKLNGDRSRFVGISENNGKTHSQNAEQLEKTVKINRKYFESNVIKIRVIRGLDTQKRLQILKLALS